MQSMAAASRAKQKLVSRSRSDGWWWKRSQSYVTI